MDELQPNEGNRPRHSGMFKPGQSGNPTGRPKESYRVSDLAKEHSEQALATLVEIAQDKKAPPSARVHAASAILDRAWGKPAQYIESVNIGGTYRDLLDSIQEKERLWQGDACTVKVSVVEVSE